MKKALVIGIDDYPGHRLRCCVNDATQVAGLLHENEDGSPNCDVDLLTSQAGDVSNWGLEQSISSFFKSDHRVDMAVLYFSGHGNINPTTDTGYICGFDSRPGSWGVSLSDLLALANGAKSTIGASVIILDCCHAGHLGEATSRPGGDVSVIGSGLTILTSSNRDEKAKETGEHGIFTDLLLDALRGGSADVRGNITPASIYSHIDQVLGAHDQRPLYKANVQQFVTLRQVKPRIPAEVLRRLPQQFPTPDVEFPLDPSYEPARDHVPEHIKLISPDPDHVVVFEGLQQCNRQGLIVPVGAKDMYYAAINSKSCKLTALGQHYRRVVEKEQRVRVKVR